MDWKLELITNCHEPLGYSGQQLLAIGDKDDLLAKAKTIFNEPIEVLRKIDNQVLFYLQKEESEHVLSVSRIYSFEEELECAKNMGLL